MHILHPFWDRFFSDFGSILAPKMEPNLIQYSMFSGRVSWYSFLIVVECDFLNFNMFSHHAMTSFLTQNTVFFLYFFDFALCKMNWKSEAKHFKNRTQNDQKIIAKWCPNRPQNRSFFGPLRRGLATSILGRFWGRFGVHFGSILGSKIGLKAIGKIIEKMIEKKSCRKPKATRDAWPVVP